MLGEGAQVADLRAREPGGGTQLFGLVVEDLLWGRRAPAEAGGQAHVDRARGKHRELLAGDRAHERAVVIVRVRAPVADVWQRPAPLDQGREDRVGRDEVCDGPLHRGAERATGSPSSAPSARSSDIARQVKLGVSRTVKREASVVRRR